MYGSLDISTSGMMAQRTRLDVIAANLANANTILDSDGNVNPYRRREVLFAPGMASGKQETGIDMGDQALGVRVAEITVAKGPVIPRTYNPDHPYAMKEGPFKGYVPETGINTVVENVNMVAAVRAYEANVMSAEAAKQMMASALRLLA
jgi:flagellar basal-body rod protein FlgC